MSRRGKDHELRVQGMGLGPRFLLSMTVALMVVMGVASLVLYFGTTAIAERMMTNTISEGIVLTHSDPETVAGTTALQHPKTGVERVSMRYGPNRRPGMAYYLPENPSDPRSATLYRFLVPGGQKLGRNMLGIIVGIMLVVVLAGAGVTLWVSKQVTRPIHRIIEDVRQVARGDLSHRTHAVGAGEIELLARSIDRMTQDLDAAQGAEVELSIREREMDLATDVRSALLPLATPMVEGYDLGAAHMSSPDIGGDFHDFIELEDGRVGLLVCDVSGQGVPAALIGATARSYLRSELQRGGDPIEAFQRINRWLGNDVRRGMFVTAMYLLIDPAAGSVTALCAGHKVPLIRLSGADGKARLVHPEGIAFGFDKGPVFDQRLEAKVFSIEVGDRLFLCNSAPMKLENADGQELGEKALFSRIVKHSSLETTAFLKAVRRDILAFAGEEGVPYDVSLVTISRHA